MAYVEAGLMSEEGHAAEQQAQKCIKDCLACHHVCLMTVAHGLAKGGPHAEPAHITRLIECAMICQTHAALLSLKSETAQRVSPLCADVCDGCAADCDGLAADDERMQACADLCRRAADSCRAMLQPEIH
jgi:hypothetical protein